MTPKGWAIQQSRLVLSTSSGLSHTTFTKTLQIANHLPFGVAYGCQTQPKAVAQIIIEKFKCLSKPFRWQSWVWKSEWEISHEQTVSWHFSFFTSGPGQSQEVQRRVLESKNVEGCWEMLSEHFPTYKNIFGENQAAQIWDLIIPIENVKSS